MEKGQSTFSFYFWLHIYTICTIHLHVSHSFSYDFLNAGDRFEILVISLHEIKNYFSSNGEFGLMKRVSMNFEMYMVHIILGML